MNRSARNAAITTDTIGISSAVPAESTEDEPNWEPGFIPELKRKRWTPGFQCQRKESAGVMLANSLER
jgi:hypothetical protein